MAQQLGVSAVPAEDESPFSALRPCDLQLL